MTTVEMSKEQKSQMEISNFKKNNFSIKETSITKFD